MSKAIKDSGLSSWLNLCNDVHYCHIIKRLWSNGWEPFNKTLTNFRNGTISISILFTLLGLGMILGKDAPKKIFNLEKQIGQLYNDGKIRANWSSNFSKEDIQALIECLWLVPMANQIPFPNIGRDQKDLLAFCKKMKLLLKPYSPLATGDLLDSRKK